MKDQFVKVYPMPEFKGRNVKYEVFMSMYVFDYFNSLAKKIKAKIAAIYTEVADKGYLNDDSRFDEPKGIICDHLRIIKVRDYINRHFVRIFCIKKDSKLMLFDYEFKKDNSYPKGFLNGKCTKARQIGIED